MLNTWNVKGNWQATSKDMVNVLLFLGYKEKFGRSPGVAGITHHGTAARGTRAARTSTARCTAC